MSETPTSHDSCAVCGSPLPAGARFCPVCGNRIEGGQPARGGLGSVSSVESPDIDAEQPTVQSPIVSGPINEPPVMQTPPASVADQSLTPPQPPPAWAATPQQWSGAPPPAARHEPGRSRTFWILIAVFGFIVFCCCALMFALFVISWSDSSFQSQIMGAIFQAI